LEPNKLTDLSSVEDLLLTPWQVAQKKLAKAKANALQTNEKEGSLLNMRVVTLSPVWANFINPYKINNVTQKYKNSLNR